MLHGNLPFSREKVHIKEFFRQLVNDEISFKRSTTIEAREFISGLLSRNPEERLEYFKNIRE